jgi:hypothetical protein
MSKVSLKIASKASDFFGRYLRLKQTYCLALLAFVGAKFRTKTVRPLPAALGTFVMMFVLQYLRRKIKHSRKKKRSREEMRRLHSQGMKYARNMTFMFKDFWLYAPRIKKRI